MYTGTCLLPYTMQKLLAAQYDQICAASTTAKSFIEMHYLPERYLSMEAAASLPAPIAEITVAAPVTASPPA